MGWAEEEFETLDLGNPRLNQRAVLLAERLSRKPRASIPGACASWSETAAPCVRLGRVINQMPLVEQSFRTQTSQTIDAAR